MRIEGQDPLRPVADLVIAARRGDQGAWRELVHKYIGMVWAIARAHRLDHYDAADVCQNTWLALAENLATVRSPESLPGWLATTSRREALRVLVARKRETPSEALDFQSSPDKCPEAQAIFTDECRILLRAFGTLPERCQRMLRLVANAPELTYTQLAKAVGLAPGSIGQTKGRCLEVLRRKAKPDTCDQ